LYGRDVLVIERLIGQQCFGVSSDTVVDLHGKGEVVRRFADSRTWLEARRSRVDVPQAETFVRRRKKIEARRGICITTESVSGA
jgi:hypothetical protein